MTNVIVILIILALILSASYYIYKEKKKGKRCIGCPYSGACSQKTCTDKKDK